MAGFQDHGDLLLPALLLAVEVGHVDLRLEYALNNGALLAAAGNALTTRLTIYELPFSLNRSMHGSWTFISSI
jgi:hypothetical protein